MITKELKFDNYEDMVNVFGTCDKNISIISENFDVKIFTSNSVLKITGEEENVQNALDALQALIR